MNDPACRAPDETPGGFFAALAMVMVYLILAPGLAALLISVYEVGVNGHPFSGKAIIAFYQFGWVFVLFAAVPHALTRNWLGIWSYLVAIPLPVAMVTMLESKLLLPALAAFTFCYVVAGWLGRRL